MSQFIVHFTKSKDGETAYDSVMSILYQQRIEARQRFGVGRNCVECPPAVCFSEIPLHRLERLAQKRGSFGVVFKKDFLVARSGGPILYAYKDTKHAEAFRQLIDLATGQHDHPMWRIAPFVDLPGSYPNASYLFEWEREWRHVGHLDFLSDDIAFLIIPEEDHEVAREFFKDVERENSGPSYSCPFIDPYWSIDKIAELVKP